MDLTDFYKANDIIYFIDALGNETWLYKEVVIAQRIAHPGEKTEVFFHWYVDKREFSMPHWEHKIHPLKKKHGLYYAPDNMLYNNPVGEFDNVNESNIEIFKLNLISSVNILKKKYQILKSKQTLIKKNYFKKLPEINLIRNITISDIYKVFRKEREIYYIKLLNGVSYQVIKLNDDDNYIIIGKEVIHLVKVKGSRLFSSFQLKKENLDQLLTIMK